MNYKHFYITPKLDSNNGMYFGTISGEENLGPIETASLDDFEKHFRQAVDDYLEEKKANLARRRTRWSIAIFAFISLLGVMAVTCPDRDAHKSVLSDRMSVILNDKVNKDSNDFSVLGAMLGNKVVEAFIENGLSVDNYFLFSVGRFSFAGEEKVVSVGAIGHIFATSKEQIRKKVSEDDTIQKFLNNLF